MPGVIGECAANMTLLRAIINESQQRLIEDPLAPDEGWYGGHARMVFNVSVGTNRRAYLTTPRNVARIISMNICSRPVYVRNGFYEFLEFGTGLRDTSSSCCNRACQITEVFERDNVATLAEFTGTKLIHIFPNDSADIGQILYLQGKDGNSNTVTRTDTVTMRAVLGESIVLAVPFVSSVNEYTEVNGILKPATLGTVSYYAYDATTGESSLLSTMEPGETTASYRRYLLNGLPNACYGGTSGTVQIEAWVKLDLIPAMSDSDYLTIQSIPALIEEAQAIRYGSMDSQTASKKEAEHHQKALRLLFGQLDHYYGKTKTAISVPIFGSDRLQRQPR